MAEMKDLKYPLGATYSAVDTFPLFKVWYDGPYKYAKATLSQTDATALVLKADDTDGATTTALTVSTVSDTTYGAVQDAVNELSEDGWHMALLGALRADLALNASTETTWVASAAANCKNTEITVLHESGLVLEASNYHLFHGITNDGVSGNNWGKQMELWGFDIDVTYGSGTTTIEVYAVDDYAKAAGTLIYTTAAGATTVNLHKDVDDWGGAPIVAPPGQRMIVRAECAGGVELTAPSVNIYYRINNVGPMRADGLYISNV